jgi:large subunit ribosomal protein L18
MSKSREDTRQRRKLHIRKKLNGTKDRPRVFVFRSNKYVYLGLANDDEGKVLFSLKGGKNKDEAIKLAKNFAKTLKTKKIKAIVFDRSGYKYSGVIKTLADTIREDGITF